jgi:hypothetical protein
MGGKESFLESENKIMKKIAKAVLIDKWVYCFRIPLTVLLWLIIFALETFCVYFHTL